MHRKYTHTKYKIYINIKNVFGQFTRYCVVYVVLNTLGCLWTLNSMFYCVFRIGNVFFLTFKQGEFIWGGINITISTTIQKQQTIFFVEMWSSCQKQLTKEWRKMLNNFIKMIKLNDENKLLNAISVNVCIPT